MRRQKISWRPWFAADKKLAGNGISDSRGQVYIVEKGGNLRRVKSVKQGEKP